MANSTYMDQFERLGFLGRGTGDMSARRLQSAPCCGAHVPPSDYFSRPNFPHSILPVLIASTTLPILIILSALYQHDIEALAIAGCMEHHEYTMHACTTRTLFNCNHYVKLFLKLNTHLIEHESHTRPLSKTPLWLHRLSFRLLMSRI